MFTTSKMCTVMKLYLSVIIMIMTVITANGLLLTTASVRDVQLAIASGTASCQQIVQGYLNRINTYNQTLGAIISINPNAIAEAARLDNFCRRTNRLIGILHCVPLIVKDNIDVAGMATTAGVNALRNMCPLIDAETIRNARQAGAIVIAKANMSPFADKEAWGNSETGGLIRNPYGLSYTTFGSSGGNGASGAAMLSILGFGTETGVSVNLPASAANLVGLRPPVSLVSQQGVLPNSVPQDVVGPMAKRVEDVALLLDAEVGNTMTRRYSAPNVLRDDGLRGVRINIFKLFTYDVFQVGNLGTYQVDPQILDLINTMVANMIRAGAIVNNVTVDSAVAMPIVMRMMTVAGYEACMVAWRDAYFSNRQRYGPQAPYHSVAELVRSNSLPKFYQDIFTRQLNVSSPVTCSQQLQGYFSDRQQFINSVITPMLNGADAAFWPTMPVFPPKLGDDAFRRDWGSSTVPTINLINAGSWSGYPTLDLPMGFSRPLPDARDGLPAGSIFIAKPENLQTLLTVAYSYQKQFGISKVSSLTPELRKFSG